MGDGPKHLADGGGDGELVREEEPGQLGQPKQPVPQLLHAPPPLHPALPPGQGHHPLPPLQAEHHFGEDDGGGGDSQADGAGGVQVPVVGQRLSAPVQDDAEVGEVVAVTDGSKGAAQFWVGTATFL